MKTGYSFGSLVNLVENLDKTTVKLSGDQTIAGLKTFSSNPITSASQGSGGGYLTRKDYVDGALALKAPLKSPALTGTPTAPTAAADTNTTQIATTAFVTFANTAQLADVAPLMDGTAGIGASTKLARQDHRHPTDTSRAPLASPALTGTPTAPTAEAGTNTTQIATTAFVQDAAASAVTAKASSSAPLMDGVATSGTSTKYAREGHIHPTDTSRAPLASPALTGIPTAPTAAEGTNTTQIATTAFVQSTAASIVTAKASSTTPLIDGTATAGTSTNYAREDHVHPTDTSRAPLASPALTGTPTAPTAEAGTNTTQIATTAFVQSIAEDRVSFRNKIIDGRFDFWYEGTSQTSTGFGSDTMWQNYNVGSTKTHTQLSLGIGSELPNVDNPSACYASRTTVSSVTGAAHCVRKTQRIEKAWTLAGKKATFSFYAKANATKDLGIHIEQSFGYGGSPSAPVVVQSTKLVITDQWVRYSLTFDVPSVAGKTFGTNSNSSLSISFGFDQGSAFGSMMGGLGHQSGIFDIACVQLEEGEQATKFEELPLAISAATVGRYYETSYPMGTTIGKVAFGLGALGNTHPKTTTTMYSAATQFKYEKKDQPYMSLFSTTSGASGTILNVTTSSSVTAIAGGVSPLGFAYINLTLSPTANNEFTFHYVADARLYA